MAVSVADLVRAMVNAGATPELIALAVEAVEAAHLQADAQRMSARDRKRRQRDRSRDSHGTVTANVTPDPLPLPPSPQTPQPPTPAPVDITTPAREFAPKPKRESPKSLVPEDWTPTPAGLRFAAERGMPPDEVGPQVERFRDHHRAKGSRFSDLNAAWRTWAGNFQDFRPRLIHERGTSRTGPNGAKRRAHEDSLARRRGSTSPIIDADFWHAQ